MAQILHSVLDGVDVHEPKNVAIANSGDVYVADGGGSGAWTPRSTFSYPALHIAGFGIENAAGDTANDVVILTGSCRDDTDTIDIILTGALTKQLDAVWAVGNNFGGRDGGAIASDTWHMFVIKNPTTDIVDAVFSLSPTAPALPAGYTKKRRVASFRRVGVAIQVLSSIETEGGGLEIRVTPVLDINRVVAASTAVTDTLATVPTGVKFDAIISGTLNQETTTPGVTAALITSLDQADTAASSTGMASVQTTATATDEFAGSFQMRVRTNTSGQIRMRASGLGATYLVTTHGWVDYRRV